MFYTERFYINKLILHSDFYLHFSDDDYRYEYKQGKGDKIVNTIDMYIWKIYMITSFV